MYIVSVKYKIYANKSSKCVQVIYICACKANILLVHISESNLKYRLIV